MADRKKIVPDSCEGDFFVDTTCMGCGNCRDLAPATFTPAGRFFKVAQQPRSAEEIQAALEALVCCPKGSIGTSPKYRNQIQETVDSFPKKIAKNVYTCGFNSPESAGGKSHIVLHENGNWMIDSPRYSDKIVQWLRSQGGLKYIFLTHRDDVGEEYDYAWEFGAKRIIHDADLEAEPNAEIVIKGIDPKTIEGDFTVIPTPGHTPGHCMLAYKNECLFTGDVLTANRRFGPGLEITDPFYCWWSFDIQTESVSRLKRFDFKRTLPAHGISFNTNTVAEMHNQIDRVVQQCIDEPDPDPSNPERIEFFRMIAKYSASKDQPLWAEIMSKRVRELENKLVNV